MVFTQREKLIDLESDLQGEKVIRVWNENQTTVASESEDYQWKNQAKIFYGSFLFS